MVLHADDLYMKSGYVYRNIAVIDTLDRYVNFKTSEGNKSVPVVAILKLEKNNYGPERELIVEKSSENGFRSMSTPTEQITPRYEYNYPNAKLVPISIMAFGFAYNFFSEASALQNLADIEKKTTPNVDYSYLDRQKSQKQIIGGIFIAAGIVNLFFVLDRVRVEATPTGAQVDVNF